MKEYHVKLIMSEEYVIEAETEEDAINEAKDKFGCDYYIDDVQVKAIDRMKENSDVQETQGCIAKRRAR